jgi:hypothetical protein
MKHIINSYWMKRKCGDRREELLGYKRATKILNSSINSLATREIEIFLGRSWMKMTLITRARRPLYLKW